MQQLSLGHFLVSLQPSRHNNEPVESPYDTVDKWGIVPIGTVPHQGIETGLQGRMAPDDCDICDKIRMTLSKVQLGISPTSITQRVFIHYESCAHGPRLNISYFSFFIRDNIAAKNNIEKPKVGVHSLKERKCVCVCYRPPSQAVNHGTIQPQREEQIQ